MDNPLQRLVDKVWQLYQDMPHDRRLLIGIAGIPGSGKTTLSQEITTLLNTHAASLSPTSPPPATFVPMDGYHLTRSQLSALPNPTEAHFRRGASFTFDAPKFLSLVQRLREAPTTTAILAPSFDHAVKDPKEDDIAILPQHRIVVLEGNYVALDKEVWRDAAGLLDQVWFVKVDFDLARRRLRERHVKAGICKDLEEGDRRARENDLVNGVEIVEHMVPVDETIWSQEEGRWRTEDSK